MSARSTKQKTEPVETPQRFPCTECGGDATIGYCAGKKGDWNGKVKIGERLCARCFKHRGGVRFF